MAVSKVRVVLHLNHLSNYTERDVSDLAQVSKYQGMIRYSNQDEAPFRGVSYDEVRRIADGMDAESMNRRSQKGVEVVTVYVREMPAKIASERRLRVRADIEEVPA